MSVEDIAQPGPDGTTPLMQLFENVSKKNFFSTVIEINIIHFYLKFGLKNVLESSIYFGNINIFSKLFTLGVSEEDSKHFANLATMAEDTNILEIILKRFPSFKGYCREIGKNCQTMPIRKMLGLSMDISANSQLIKMSAKFPKFNEDVEISIEKISKESNPVSSLRKTLNHYSKTNFVG